MLMKTKMGAGWGHYKGNQTPEFVSLKPKYSSPDEIEVDGERRKSFMWRCLSRNGRL